MAISYLDRGLLRATTGIPTPPAWPGHQAGDLGLLLVETANQPISAPSGWTQIGSDNGQGTPGAAGATCTQVFWRIAASASEAAITLPDAGDHTIAQVFAWRGVHPDTPIDATPAQGTASGTTLTLSGVTRATSGALVVIVVSSGLDSTTLGAEFVAWFPARGRDLVERQDVTRPQGVGGGFGVAEQPAIEPGGTGETEAFYVTKTTSETVDYTVFALRPAQVQASPSGVSATGALGSASASADAGASPAGVAATSALGGATTSAGASASPAGLSASGALGDVAAGVWVEGRPAGVAASTALGDVAAGPVRDATAYPAGVSTGGTGVCEAPPPISGGVRVVREHVTRLAATVAPLGVGAGAAVGEGQVGGRVGTPFVPTRSGPTTSRVVPEHVTRLVPTLESSATVVPSIGRSRGALGSVAARGEDWLADDELALILTEIAGG